MSKNVREAQQQVIKESVSAGKPKARINCPFCLKDGKSMSVTFDRGSIIYHCFEAMCKVSGKIGGVMSISDAIDWFNTEDRSLKTSSTFTLPDYMIPPNEHPTALRWLERNNCLPAYESGAVDVRYDPKLNRLVFIIYNGMGYVVDAVGRLLEYQHNVPKWYRYGSSDYPFVCYSCNNCPTIIVEDAASACAVYGVGTGVSLLGTKVNFDISEVIRDIKCKVGVSEIILALDKDASKKALELIKQFEWSSTKARVVLLTEDLKYFNVDQIKQILQVR